jgi:hypothetical protein
VAEVRIPKKRFTSLSFPSVCAVTGLPAAEVFAFTFDGLQGGLPLNQTSVRLVRQQQITLKVLVVAVVALFSVAAFLRSPVIMAGSLLTAAIVLANFAAIRSRLPRGTVDGKELVLKNVHTDFVNALDNPPGPHAAPGGKCAGCPTAAVCADEKVDTCTGHDSATLAGNNFPS